MREASVNDIAAEFISIMELSANEAYGLVDRLITRKPRELSDSGRRHRRGARRRSSRKSGQANLA